MERRVYYDHEPVYRQVAANGGQGWHEACIGGASGDLYQGVMQFLNSPLCPDSESASALDLGCGGGQVAIMLAQRGFEVTAVDYSETAISLGVANAAKAGVKISFHVGDCTNLDFLLRDSFQLVIDNHVAHCLIEGNHRAAFFAEIRRLLASNGVFFSETLFACEHLDPAAVELVAETSHNVNRTRNWVSRRRFVDELTSAGLDILSKSERHLAPLTTGCLLTTVAY